MAPSNSTKKVAKAARASSGRRTSAGRSSRSLSFPITLGVIVLVGVLLVFVGRNRRVDAAEVSPKLGEHWHAAYGVYICDSFIPGLSDRHNDARGVHTHADGIIHIHPYSSAAAGKRSNLGDFFSEVDADVSNGRIALPGDQVWEDGTACPDGQPGRVVLARWNSADDPAAPPDIITGDIADVRFTQDRMAFTLAFVPESRFAEIPRPESIPTLDNLSDVPTSAGDPAATVVTDATGNTVGGTEDSTADSGGTSSTAAGGDGATTTSSAGTTGTSGGG
jgi:hypothetical protein